MPALHDPADLLRLEAYLDSWFSEQLESNPAVVSVEHNAADSRRWFVRLAGEDKEFSMVQFELGQRSLFVQTYVMPSPIENEAEFFAYLLRRNHKLYGAKFAIGAEDGIYLEANLDNALIEVDDEMDRVLGSIYVWVEDYFHAALRIGFASKFS